MSINGDAVPVEGDGAVETGVGRIGVFGGSFDPVHTGHLMLAEQCREQMRLDRVWFVPAARPPHKPGVSLAPMADRMALLRLATAGRPDFEARDLESDREGRSYTVDTLRQIREETGASLVFLMGADSLADLPSWRDPEGIAELAEIAAVNRGFGDAEVPATLPEAVRSRVNVVEMPACGISASDVRRRVREGRSVRYLVPRAVELAIGDRPLYDG